MSDLADKKVSDLSADEFINILVERVSEKIKPQTPTYLTTDNVCQRFSITQPCLYGWIRKGILKAHKIGGRTLFLESELTEISADQKGKWSKNKEG